MSGWKRKNVAKLAPHQQMFVGTHFVVAPVASSNLAHARWKKPGFFCDTPALAVRNASVWKQKTGAPVQAKQPGTDAVCSIVKNGEVGMGRLFFFSLLVQL